MKKYLPILISLLVVLIIVSAFKQKKKQYSPDDKWSGTVSFSQIVYDTVHGTHACGWHHDTSWSEWHMEADIINNTGIAKSSNHYRLRGSGYDSCVNAWGRIRDTCDAFGQDQTELDIGIDEEAKEYGFTVNIPPCSGTGVKISYRNGVADVPVDRPCGQGETQIFVDQQKLGTNRNILSGTIIYDTLQQPGSRFVQIWKWNLVREK